MEPVPESTINSVTHPKKRFSFPKVYPDPAVKLVTVGVAARQTNATTRSLDTVGVAEAAFAVLELVPAA
jgi:hypothetical protein